MEKNKNLRLRMGLCGLALTSFLALNAHSTVHADTVQGANANNNAITWDSDSDDSQIVKEEPQQQTAPQSVQKQAKQSTVQASQSQPVQNKKIMVSDVSSTSVSQKRAEAGIVRQSNVQTSTVNRLNADNHVAKVDVASANKPVQITNPQNNQIVVHYVKTNGQSAGLADQTITLSKSGNGNYNLPSGYQLAISSGPYNVQADRHIVHHDAVTKPVTNVVKDANNQDVYNIGYNEIDNAYDHSLKSTADRVGSMDDHTYHAVIPRRGTMGDTGNIDSGAYELERQVRAHGSTIEDGDYVTFDGYDNDDTSGVYSPTGYKYYKAGSNTPLYHVNNPDQPDSYCSEVPRWLTSYMASWSIAGGAYPRLVLNAAPKTETKNVTTPAYDETVGNNIFTDNSGNIKSVVGNVVNVVVTKPEAVNDASQTRKSAERIISVNLPDDQAARDRYKGILNSNSQIVQTINFTRSITQDALTGNALSETNWQGPSSFPSVTLPDIPGYTMTMS